LQTLFQSLAII